MQMTPAQLASIELSGRREVSPSGLPCHVHHASVTQENRSTVNNSATHPASANQLIKIMLLTLLCSILALTISGYAEAQSNSNGASTLQLAQADTQSAGNNDRVLDAIIAVVNNGIILRSELESDKQFLIATARSNRQSLPSDAVLDERVLERLILREVQRQRAQELGIDVDPSSVNDAVEQVASNNGMNTFEFRQTLEEQGLDYNQFRNNLKHELLLDRLIQRDVARTINVSEQEIDDYLNNTTSPSTDNNTYQLRHILIAEPSTSSSAAISAARNRALALVQRLNNGEDFAALAVAESDGKRALQGGDLGAVKLANLPRFLVGPVSQMRTGDISEPIQSPDGFHIVTVTGIRAGEEAVVTETRARHIFLEVPTESQSDTIRETLAGIRQQITRGASFSDLAAEFSEDPNSSANGGELPWFTPGQLPSAMEAAADALNPGELSQLFRTEFGWHILEVLERRQSTASDRAARREAELSLRQNRLEQEADRWSRRLRDEAFVEILDR